MKKFITILMVLTIIFSTVTTVNAYTLIIENKIDIMVDGVIYPPEKGFGEMFFDKNGRTQIPVRWASGVMGATLEWNPETGGIVITKGDSTVELTIGSDIYIDNGTPKEMDTVAFVIENRTYVPIRFLAEPLGYKVDYIRNHGQVKESNKTHIVKLTFGSEEKGAENDNSSGTTTIKGISVNPNFSQSQELVALQKQGYVKITENSVSANFNPKQSWISPLIYGLNEKYGYYKVTLPYDPQNEEAYLEVLKHALQFSVEKGELIYNKFEEVIRVSDDMTVSMEEWEKYKAENCRKFIKVADNVYYNIYFTQGGQLQLIVSQEPVW